MPAGCEIPMPTRDNMEEYLEQQMREQQYETQQMAEKIRAQFEGENQLAMGNGDGSVVSAPDS